MTTPENSIFFRHLRGLSIMPKWKIFIWKLWHNCLATSANLHHRGIISTDHYSVCLHDNENDQHIFRFCPLATEAWEGNGLRITSSHHPSMSLASWIIFWLEQYLKEDGHMGLRLPVFIATLWAIWKIRNDQVFRQVRATLEGLNAHITETMHQHTRFTADDDPLFYPPPAPNYSSPLGFIITELGQVKLGVSDLVIQIDGS